VNHPFKQSPTPGKGIFQFQEVEYFMKDRSKNRSSIYIIFALLFVVFSVLTIFQYRHIRDRVLFAGAVNSVSANGPAEVKFLKRGEYPSFVSGGMEPGNIRLELSPENIENDRLRIRFFANAHDLTLESFNLAQMTTLQYGDRKLKPTYSDRMKGHHDSGLILFDLGKLHDPAARSKFSITISGLPSEEVRVFRWE
jgi:hypothetical protein